MRQTISGLVAAIAVVAAGTVPASACGLFESTLRLGYVAAPGLFRLQHRLRRLGL